MTATARAPDLLRCKRSRRAVRKRWASNSPASAFPTSWQHSSWHPPGRQPGRAAPLWPRLSPASGRWADGLSTALPLGPSASSLRTSPHLPVRSLCTRHTSRPVRGLQPLGVRGFALDFHFDYGHRHPVYTFTAKAVREITYRLRDMPNWQRYKTMERCLNRIPSNGRPNSPVARGRPSL
jgi:hypothetical protein